MSEMRNRRIEVIRTYLDPDAPSIPVLDYDLIYPITTYAAVHRTMEETSTTLTAELEAIYDLISTKQNTITGGTSGKLMTWTNTPGVIGETEIVTAIADRPEERSYQKVVSESAVGTALDGKVASTDFIAHTNDSTIHVTAAERGRWDNTTPISAFEEHAGNGEIHITEEERERWNDKADQEEFASHATNRNNPHAVTAYQVGTYTRSEIDALFANIRTSFFNYRNIRYDGTTATLEEYDPEQWNPNFVLQYGTPLPTDGIDPSQTYFALIPQENYEIHETDICLIWVKEPGSEWRHVGTQSMTAGDLVIEYPNTAMCVWLQGRFVHLSSGGGDLPEGTYLWRPQLITDESTHQTYLTFTLSDETDPPTGAVVSGPPGYTPIKGVDYFDGEDGIGVPAGGNINDIMYKASEEDYDVEWMSFEEYLGNYIAGGGIVPGLSVDWDDIRNKPDIVQNRGNSPVNIMSQDAVTNQLISVDNQINDIWNEIHSHGSVEELADELDAHINDHNNPHAITPVSIGAVSLNDFGAHTLNQNNPHHVTAAQIGLGNVNNTADYDKPISRATQAALEVINDTIAEIEALLNSDNLVSNVTWNEATTTLGFVFRDGSEKIIHIPLLEIFESITFDNDTSELVIILPNGDEHRIDIGSLIARYEGYISNTINLSVEDGIIRGDVRPNSIDGTYITSSVALRGDPTANTQNVYDDSDKLATTKFVKNTVIDNLESSDNTRPLSANMGRILDANKTTRAEVLQMIADSPMLNVVDDLSTQDSYSALSANMGYVLNTTKAPQVHTSTTGSTFGRATAALFGHVRSSNVDPLMDGIVSIGTDNGYYARADHRHPSDTNKAPINWPDPATGVTTFTGEPKAPTPPDGDDSTRIATTEWVNRNGGGDVEPIPAADVHQAISDAWDSVVPYIPVIDVVGG